MAILSVSLMPKPHVVHRYVHQASPGATATGAAALTGLAVFACCCFEGCGEAAVSEFFEGFLQTCLA